MLKQCMGCQSPPPSKKTTLKRGSIAPTNTDSKWQDRWMVLNSPGLPPITAAPAASPSFLPTNEFTPSTCQVCEYRCCTKCRTAEPAGGSPMPSVTAVSQGLCSIPPLKSPVNYRPLGWKVSSIWQWKLMLMPHKFSGNCPYLFIDLLMAFSLCLKGVGRKRARPGPLWHHASAVKTNWTFSPPGSPYFEHWFIQCYFLLC